jgi:hypothetical protein
MDISGQKLGKIAGGKWLNKIIPILVEGVDMDRRRFW